MFDKVVNFLRKIDQNNNIKIIEEASNFKNFELPDEEILSWALEDIEEEFSISINKEVLFTEDFKVKWEKIYKTRELSGVVYGGFHLSIHNAILGKQDEKLQENPLNHPQDLVDNLYIFNKSETINHMSQHGNGCFYREHGKWPLDIYFFDAGVRIKMNISLNEYIQALVDSCAVAYWQYFYIDIDELIKQNIKMKLRDGVLKNSPIDDKDLDSPRLSYLLYELDIFIRNLPNIFPDKDFSYHKNRLDQIKEAAQPYLLIDYNKKN